MLHKETAAQKESRLSIRASEPEKSLLREAARARRMNTSEFVRQASLDAARATLVDQTEFRLPPEQWAAFCERVDAPARMIPALRQLFSESDPYSG
ncbi:MAG TPA: DUF1778 domain-containing protein [Armatimonadota bacterium]|nr:DUF1778 domain-containing protein [Armatimonadota bacterium]